MSKEEIKLEINKILDGLPEKTLQDILSFLRNIKGEQGLSFVDYFVLDKSLSQDKDLLQNLSSDTN